MKKLIALAILTLVCVVSAQLATRTITIRIPASFTAAQEKFLIASVLAQVETEMGNALQVPTNDVAIWKTNVDLILKTNNLPVKYAITNAVKTNEVVIPK